MTCEEVERDELVEQYVLGQLDESVRDAFEDHYFSCPACLERLQVVEETRGALTAGAAPRRLAGWRRLAAGLAAAATLVIAVRVGQIALNREEAPAGPPATPAADVVLPAPGITPSSLPPGLGEIELPVYTPLRLRSTASEAQRVFRDAMERYRTGGCEPALPGLQRSLEVDAELTPAHFYVSACELRAGRLGEAEQHLQRVIARGESAYLEDARFFLAKVRIRQGDRDRAREELRHVVSLNGDRRAEANRLLEQLR